MRRYIHTFMSLMAVAFATAIVASCDENTIFDSYEHTPISGWEKNDTLCYNVPPLIDSGSFEQIIGIRINRYYPFTSLSLIIDQHIHPGFRHHLDTLECVFRGKKNLRGEGVSYTQYDFPLRQMDLRRGDSLDITIRHAMKREILPGISDVGLKIVKKR